MSIITVEKVNESHIKVQSESGIQMELSDFFSFENPQAKFIKYQSNYKYWDGNIRLYNRRNKLLPAGLLRHLEYFAQERGYKIEGYQHTSENISAAEVIDFCKSLDLISNYKSIFPYEHQLKAITKALRYRRVVLESSTSSGKSLIAYVISRYLLNKGLKGLIVVPTLGLVEQMHNDFIDYSTNNKWDVQNNVYKIYADQNKFVNYPLFVSTWQSIFDLENKDWFKQFDFVIFDEAHKCVAKSLIRVAENLTKASYRIGMTGTVQDGLVPKLTLEGHIGPITKIATNKEMIEKGISTDVSIKAIILKYNSADCYNTAQEKNYQKEIEYIVTNHKRNKFITNLALSLKENTLITFQYIEKQGDLLYSLLKKGNKKVFYLQGKSEVEERESVRRICEKENGVVILASTLIFQEGVSIKNLHNIILAMPTKSKIRLLQTIGRGLRLHDNKLKCKLFDIVDDLRFDDYINYSLKHYLERIKVYNREEFNYHIYNVNLG
jgi:superfamily II DNA or RNA helicase